ncbi:MAG: nicotinate dehydrogenase subunit A [Gammaproteobacteria bacterium]|jgi:nicotinate dehydrogenase subunit A
MTDISFTVNGRAATAVINPADTLLHVLRNHIELKGTRYGCGIEECGACMVLVNGKPTYSCTFAAEDIAGQSVTTVEGLARSDGDSNALHPVQQAFLDEQAGQCGYCLSGIIVSATALLDANPDPSREQIVAALDSHLCRCGAHTRMLRAVERAAAAMRSEVAS